MKRLQVKLAWACLATSLALASCDTTKNSEKTIEGSGSQSETTPNDSSGAESTKAMGTGEGNQKDSLGYPPNQSNLNADTTRQKHDN